VSVIRELRADMPYPCKSEFEEQQVMQK
jgi:hypothetical protein